MAIETSNVVHAMAYVVGDPVTPTLGQQAGFVTGVSRVGTGEYDLTLDEEIAATESVVMLTGQSVGVDCLRVGRPDAATVKVILTTNAGAAVDGDCAVIVYAVPLLIV